VNPFFKRYAMNDSIRMSLVQRSGPEVGPDWGQSYNNFFLCHLQLGKIS
jgi:hypothetical protein